MSSSVGNSSVLNLTLLNQLLQRAGAETGETGAAATTDAAASQGGDGTTSFSAQAEALFNAFDTDGDGKLSKSELQSGFQKLSQDMRSVLIGQQAIGTSDAANAASQTVSGAGAFAGYDTDGDGAVSADEFKTALSGATTAGDNAAGTTRLLDRLLQAAASDGTAAATDPAAAGASSDTTQSWQDWLQRMQNSDIGDVANQSAMASLHQSINLDASLSQLLQATDLSAGTGPGTI